MAEPGEFKGALRNARYECRSRSLALRDGDVLDEGEPRDLDADVGGAYVTQRARRSRPSAALRKECASTLLGLADS